MRSQPASSNVIGGAEPFLSTANQACVSIPTGPVTQQVWPIRSQDFKLWLRVRYENEYGCPPPPAWLRSTIEQMEARARFGTQAARPVAARFLTYENSIVLDLAGPSGQCVEITAGGWKTSAALPHAFTRHPGMGPLPEPQPAGPDQPQPLEQFRALLNVQPGADWARVLTFLTASVAGLGPCPILVLEGPSGSGKTTAARMLQSLIDPALGPPGLFPSTLSALRKQAADHRVLVFDDVHRIGPATACELAHLSDDDSQPRAIILIRASSSHAGLPQNLECRALTVTMGPLPALRTLFELRNEFEQTRPFVLAALCTAVSETLQRLPVTVPPELTRLANATVLTLGAASALQLAPSQITEAMAARTSPVFSPEPSLLGGRGRRSRWPAAA